MKKDNYPERSIPPHGLTYAKKWWVNNLNISQKVAVYWPEGPDSVTVVGYYDTVSSANTAALAAVDSGTYPRVAINYWHSTITHIQVGARMHRDATVALPDWIDAQPGYQYA